MGIDQVIGYKTSDGKTFDKLTDAWAHETDVQLNELVRDSTFCGEFDFDAFMESVQKDDELRKSLITLLGGKYDA